MHAVVEHLASSFTGVLRAIHSNLCVTENILSFCARISAESNTNTRHDDDLVAVQVERNSQPRLKTLRYPHGITRIMKLLYEPSKLVPPWPGQGAVARGRLCGLPIQRR